MRESLFQQAARVLKALKMDTADPYNNEIALMAIKRYGSFEAVFRELSKERYDRLRYTPEIMLSSIVETEDDLRGEAEALAEKLHSLRKLAMSESNAKGISFDQILKEVDVIRTLSLSSKEAWAVKFAGGKDFIDKLPKFPNGDRVADVLVEALQRAEEHIQSAKAGNSIATTTSSSLALGNRF